MSRYFIYTKCEFMENIVFRAHFYFIALGNLLYVAVIYFLWKAIYENSNGTINGMDFNQVVVYLTLAISFYSLFLTWTDWDMSRGILSGDIIMDLIKPVDLQMRYY